MTKSISNNKFKKGVLIGLLYYGAGALLSTIIYWILGDEYAHVPGFHYIIAFLFVLGGALMTLYYGILFLAGVREKIDMVFGSFTALQLLCC